MLARVMLYLSQFFGRWWFYIIPSRWRKVSVAGKVYDVLDKSTSQVEARATRRLSWRALLWIFAHLLFLVVGFLVLHWVNQRLQLELALRSRLPWLHQYWLPLLFVLLYVLGWLAWGVYKLLTPDGPTGDHPDIDDAWAEAVLALEKASLEPTELPLFLVFGKPAGSFADVFAAAGVALTVRGVPEQADAPLHVYAGRDGIFVTCEGASLLGYQAERFVAAPVEGEKAETLSPAEPLLPGAVTLEPLLPPEALPAPPTAGPATATVGEDPFGELLAEPANVALVTAPSAGTAQRLSLMKRAGEVHRLTERLQYLCRLVARRRHPYCPVNGLLWLVPQAATEPAAEIGQVGLICQRDRRTAVEALQVNCPSYVLVCDAEQIPGFPALLDHVPEGPLRQRLAGPTFPVLPDMDEKQQAEMLPAGVRWLCRTLVPTLAYRLFRLESVGEPRWPAVEENARLVQLLEELREREGPLARLLARGFGPAPDDKPMLGGCYLAATGPDAAHQAFVGGAFRQLIASQNSVTWTEEAQQEERDFRRLTWFGYLGLLVLILAVGYLLISMVPS